METVSRVARFDDDLYYAPKDPAMKVIGSPGALAVQRHRGQGPPYTKVGRRVLYLGRDLNQHIDAGRVETGS